MQAINIKYWIIQCWLPAKGHHFRLGDDASWRANPRLGIDHHSGNQAAGKIHLLTDR